MKVFLIKYPFSISTRLNQFYRDPKLSSKIKERNQITKFYPKQHPKNLYSPDSSLIYHDRKPIKALTPYKEIPESLYATKETENFEQPKNPKTFFAGIFGATNVGKSTLMNKLINENLSAISRKSQTTDEKITGIHSNYENSTQLILYDTPGIIEKYKRQKKSTTKAWEAMDEIDCALFVVDGTKKRIDEGIKDVLIKMSTKNNEMNFLRLSKNLDIEDAQVLKAKPQKLTKILVVNKIDLCTNKRDLKWFINELEDLGNFDKIFYISCETDYGVETLRSFLEGEAIKDDWLFNPKVKTEMSEVERIEEVVKSIIFERMHHELPFLIGIELTEFVVMSNSSAKIEINLDVETQTQMKILIGYHGRNVKYLAQKARIELIKLYKKDFNVSIVIKRRNESLKQLKEQPGIEEIIPKGLAKKEAKDEVERMRKERSKTLDKAAQKLFSFK